MGTSPNMMNGDTMGLPPAIARRKNGLMQALMSIPEDDQGMGMGASQPSASPTGDAAPQSQPRQDRFMDDQPTRSQQPQSLKDKMDAGDYSDMQVGQPQQQNDHLSQLQGEYDKLGQPRPPMKLWQKIALGASAPFGGLQGFVQERNQQNERTDKQRSGLLQQIEAERRMQEQEQLGTQRMTLQERMRQESEQAQADRQQPEHMDTDQGPIQWDRNAKNWTPIQVGGKPVGPKATKPDKPDSLEQQYDAAVSSGDKPTANRLLNEMRAMGAAKQPPQRDPQQLAIGPDGKVIALKPGMTVPQGSMTASAELGKPNADEQRRADLAENMNENLDQLEEIVKRRPGLFGQYGGGLLTSVRGKVGTGDKDIAALEAIKEYLGMASVGAHSMRNAQHVGAAADAVMAGFRNSPEAMLNAIKIARQSTETFKGDIERSRGRGGPAQPGGQSLKQKQALTVEEAQQYLQQAGGDKDKARALAKKDGRTF